VFRVLAVFIFLSVTSISGFSQVLSPSGLFLKDSLKIGEEVAYSLSIKYPKNIDVVFPDSTYSFQPFELIRKVSYPTRSDSIFSFDSAVYILTTFELDSTQRLDLPVFLVTKGDSTIIKPASDSIVLNQVVKTIPDSISMIENTAFSNVKLGFNYPYLVVGLTTLGILIILGFLIFGKTIKKKIMLYRLNRMHKKFLEKFNAAIRDLKAENDYGFFEHLLMDWKSYMEKLNKTPFTKLTSREINLLYPDKELITSLQDIDKVIYGRMKITDIPRSFDYLRRASEDSFHNKVQEIKNG
jgi:hypothetical protein